MKKFLSVSLSLVMLFCILLGVDITSFAEGYYEDESNNTFQTATILSPNTNICGYAGKNDVDFYRIDIDTDGFLTIKFTHSYNDDGYWYFELYRYNYENKNYEKMSPNSYKNRDYQMIAGSDGDFNTPKQGVSKGSTYFVKIYTNSSRLANVAYIVTPYLTPSLNCETEINDDFNSADCITFGETISGYITDGDYDFYKLIVPKGLNTMIDFSHEFFREGYWEVELYNYNEYNYDFEKIKFGEYSGRQTIRCSDDTFHSPTVLTAGTYFVCVSGTFNASDVKYTLSLNSFVTAPKTLKAISNKETSIKLNWNKVSGVSGYELQRLSGNSYKTVSTTTSTDYTAKKLTSSTEYKFRVRAYKTVGNKKYYSSWTCLSATTVPSKVGIKKLSTNKKHEIKVNWKTLKRVNGYQVQICSNKGCANVVTSKIVSGQSKSCFTVKNLSKGKKYFVRVRAYKNCDGKKHYGSWSDVKSVKAK